MKNKAILSLAGIIVIVLTVWVWASRRPIGAETALYRDLGHFNQESLKAVQGQYFLLHFWAKWCEPCAEEIPGLVQFARLMNEKKTPDGKPLGIKRELKILAVSLDPSLEDSKLILPNHGEDLPPNFILALDRDHAFAEKMGSYQYPETYFISPKGEVLEKWIGLQKWLQPQVFEFFLQKLL